MKKIFLFTYVFIFIHLTAGASNPFKSLHILAPLRMLDPNLISQFEKENGCEVKVDFVVDDSGVESQLRSDLKTFDLVIADERSLVRLSTANLLKTLPESIQQSKHAKNSLQIKSTFNSEVNTYVPIFVNPLGIAYRPSISIVDEKTTWNALIDNDKNPYWRQHLYIPERLITQISLALLANPVELKNTRRLPQPTLRWLTHLRSQKALLTQPLIYAFEAKTVNAAVIFYSEYLRHKEYVKDLDFAIPSDGTYFERYGVAWCLSSQQEELAQKFMKYMKKNSGQFAEFNRLLDIKYGSQNNKSSFFQSNSFHASTLDIKKWKIYDESFIKSYLPDTKKRL